MVNLNTTASILEDSKTDKVADRAIKSASNYASFSVRSIFFGHSLIDKFDCDTLRNGLAVRFIFPYLRSRRNLILLNVEPPFDNKFCYRQQDNDVDDDDILLLKVGQVYDV